MYAQANLWVLAAALHLASGCEQLQRILSQPNDTELLKQCHGSSACKLAELQHATH